MKAACVNRYSIFLLLSLVLLVLVTVSSREVVAQTTVVNITSYHVDGAPNYNAPGNESFWKNIGWTNVSLGASVSPGGGHTSSVLVKSANDGFNIYVLFRWHDLQGPAYGASPELYYNSSAPPGSRYQLLNPSVTGLVKQLVYNSTYYYPDRVAMLWFLNGTRDVVPAMKLNSTGAITVGSANIWHWQANPTDNNRNDTGFSGGYFDPKGNSIFPPNNSSFAENDYTDKDGFFLVNGNFTGAPPIVNPYGNPFLVLAGNYFSDANKTWTVEMVRPFAVLPDVNHNVQLSVGSTYFVGFAVWNGKMGESQHIKSVSQWYSLTISNLAPPSPTTSTGVSLTLAAATGAGLLIAGVIIGIVAKPEKKKPAA